MSDPISYTLGPISLIFGSESPIQSNVVSRHFPSRKRSTSSQTAAKRQYIHHLSLLGCHLCNIKGVFELLGKKVRREVHLKELAICHLTPKLGNEEMVHLAHGLSKNSNLLVLDLTGSSFDARGLYELKPFFEENRSLEVLSLSENANFGDAGMQALLSFLKSGKSLRVLNLESSGLHNFGTAAPSLMRFIGSSLHTLELSHNNIGDTGVEILAKCIKAHTTLEHLGLKNASVGDYGIISLADTLATNKTMHTLNLQNNASITDVGASHILKSVYNAESISTVVKSNHTLKRIELRGCINISQNMQYSIYLMLSKRTVQFKVSKYFESFGCVSALGSLDSLLLPDILSFVGKMNGLDVLFRTIRNIPLLYNTLPKAEPVKNDSSTSFKLDEGKETSSRMKQFHFFFDMAPKGSKRSWSLLVKYTDGRNRCKHESRVGKSTNNYVANILSNTVHMHNFIDKRMFLVPLMSDMFKFQHGLTCYAGMKLSALSILAMGLN